MTMPPQVVISGQVAESLTALPSPMNGDLKGMASVPCMEQASNVTVTSPRRKDFRGRESEMQQLEKRLPLGAPGQVCVWGPAGMGKSQLALEFSRRRVASYRWQLWMDGGKLTTLHSNYIGLAKSLGLFIPEETEPAVALEAVKEHLWKCNELVLLVVDNVESPLYISELLPAFWKCHVLIVTRTHGGFPGLENFQLQPLGEAERMELAAGGEEFQGAEEEALKKVCEEVGCVTLCLACVSGIIRGGSLPSWILDQLQVRPEGEDALEGRMRRLFDTSFDVMKRSRDFPRKVKKLARAMVLVGGWFACAPVRTKVLVHAAEGLRRERMSLWREAMKGCWTEGLGAGDCVQDAVDLLVRYRLMSRVGGSGEESLVWFHGLVQDYARGQREAREAALAFLVSLAQGPADVAKDVVHFKAACDWLVSGCGNLKVPQRVMKMAVEDIALGLAYHVGCEKQQFEEGLGIVESVSNVVGGGSRNLTRARLASTKASILAAHANYEEAEPLFRRSLEIEKSALGEDHPTYGVTLHNLANLLKSQSKYDEAEPLCRRALEIAEGALGEKHSSCGVILHTLASLLEARGNYTEAEALYQRSLEITEGVLGPDHTSCATTLHNLACLLNARGKYVEAEALYQRSLKRWEADLGKDRPEFATTLVGLALLLEKQARYAEAEPLYRRALEIMEGRLGKDHSQCGTALHGLASLLEAQGRYTEAEELYRRCLEIKTAALGDNRLSLAMTLHSLAGLLKKQGKYGEAEPLYERSLEIKEAVLGKDHEQYGMTLHALAGLLDARGELAKAEPLYRRSLEIKEVALGTDHVKCKATRHNLAAMLERQGKYVEAEVVYRRLLEIEVESVGLNHPSYATTLNNLASLLEKERKYAEAEPLYRRAVEIKAAVLGTDHPRYVTTLNNLAGLLEKRGKYAEAKPMYRRLLEIKQAALGKERDEYGATLNNLAGLEKKEASL